MILDPVTLSERRLNYVEFILSALLVEMKLWKYFGTIRNYVKEDG